MIKEDVAARFIEFFKSMFGFWNSDADNLVVESINNLAEQIMQLKPESKSKVTGTKKTKKHSLSIKNLLEKIGGRVNDDQFDNYEDLNDSISESLVDLVDRLHSMTQTGEFGVMQYNQVSTAMADLFNGKLVKDYDQKSITSRFTAIKYKITDHMESWR